METSSVPNANTIINILTLRYNQTSDSLLPKISSKDFVPTNDNPSIDFIQKTMENEIRSKIGTDNGKIAIALSGGVDSTLAYNQTSILGFTLVLCYKKSTSDIKISCCRRWRG
ncbi:MAG: hypothetical protein EB150_09825 [Nitrososphaeria archaeon]|nr:hypothetical protein [Nitrososphaeria archaeon]